MPNIEINITLCYTIYRALSTGEREHILEEVKYRFSIHQIDLFEGGPVAGTQRYSFLGGMRNEEFS